MTKILITGATGNVGIELIHYISQMAKSEKISLAVRDIEKSKSHFKKYPQFDLVKFDFDNPESFDKALDSIDRIFLLRPPHISDVERVFRPLLTKIKEKKIKDIVFLSVQGVEKSKIIPHHKIESLIKEYTFNYIFLRPSYFMQNLTTTLHTDIKTKRAIILPAAQAKFNWIDIKNIAELAALFLLKFDEFKNNYYEITGPETINFEELSNKINSIVKRPIIYKNVNPIKFYFIKKDAGLKFGLIIVMIMLHFLPRFQNEPKMSKIYKELTAKEPTDLNTFIKREIEQFE